MEDFCVEDNYNLIRSNSEHHPSLDDYLNNLKTDYNYDPFISFKNFIISDILPSYKNLIECNLFKEDEYGEPINDYYIKFIGDLSFSERKKLNKKIINEVKSYAKDFSLLDEFKEISIFLIR